MDLCFNEDKDKLSMEEFIEYEDAKKRFLLDKYENPMQKDKDIKTIFYSRQKLRLEEREAIIEEIKKEEREEIRDIMYCIYKHMVPVFLESISSDLDDWRKCSEHVWGDIAFLVDRLNNCFYFDGYNDDDVKESFLLYLRYDLDIEAYLEDLKEDEEGGKSDLDELLAPKKNIRGVRKRI